MDFQDIGNNEQCRYMDFVVKCIWHGLEDGYIKKCDVSRVSNDDDIVITYDTAEAIFDLIQEQVKGEKR